MRMLNPLLPVLLCALSSHLRGSEFEQTLAKANQGDTVAQVQAATAYETGTGVKKDIPEAAKWYENAAVQGDAAAQWKLGTLYLGGRGLRRDSPTAASWFRLAADQGRADAQLQLARMHLSGAGVPKDDVEAYKWAELARKQKNHQATQLIRFLKQRMPAADIAKAMASVEEFEELRKLTAGEIGVPLIAPLLEEEDVQPAEPEAPETATE